MNEYIVTVSAEKDFTVRANNKREALEKVSYNTLKNRLPSVLGHESIVGLKVTEPDNDDATYCCGVCDECKSAIKKECEMYFDFTDSLADENENTPDTDTESVFKEKILSVIDAILCKTSGYSFYNTSNFDFAKLIADPDNIEANFDDYIKGFSGNIKDKFCPSVLRLCCKKS